MTLPAAARQKAAQRMEFVRRVLERADRHGMSHELACRTVEAADGAQFPDLLHAGKGGKSALTYCNFRNWLARVRRPNGTVDESRLPELADKHAGGRQAMTGQECTGEFMQIFARFYEHANRLSFKAAHRLAVAVARKSGIHPEAIPTVGQVTYHYATKVDRNSVLQARMGEDWAEQHLADYITRDWSGVLPGEVWFGDHHIFDAPCKVQTPDGKWKAVRPWLTAWMDARSRYLVGWIIRADEDPNSLVIEDALIMGIRANGNRPPARLYTDNGKDYTSAGFITPVFEGDGRPGHSICRELGCLGHLALPYNARAKTVERFFLVATEFAKYWAAYLGNRPGTRPEAAQWHWENPETLPSLQEFTEAFAWFLDHMYHNQPNLSKATGGRAPAEIWAERPEIRAPLTDLQLYMAFLKPMAQTRLVKRGGRLMVAGREYHTQELWPLIGKPVMVKLDRFDLGKVHAFREDGGWICEAREVQALPAIGADRDLLSAAMADNRRLMSHSRELHRERTGETKIIPAMDRLRLADPTITPEQVERFAETPATMPEAETAEQIDVHADLALKAALVETIFGGRASTPADDRGAEELQRMLATMEENDRYE
jgi:hypothetical protein